MALVEWTEDYGQYKKGDQFALNDKSSRDYLVETGKIKVVDESYTNETVSEKVATAEEQQEAAEKIASVEEAKPSKKASK